MTGRLTVGVKYCGHCNPQKDGPALVRNLQDRLPEMEVVCWYDLTYDVLLVVGACPSNCVTPPAFNGPRIEIAAGEIRSLRIPPGNPALQLLKACLEEGLGLWDEKAENVKGG